MLLLPATTAVAGLRLLGSLLPWLKVTSKVPV